MELASDTVTIEVAPLQVLADVQFDLDRSMLRPDALECADEGPEDPERHARIRLHIEGYASPEGSAAYNKALERAACPGGSGLPGEPRHRPVAADHHQLRRGTSQVRHSQPATLALNRRAALIIDSAADRWRDGPWR